jgi:phosphopantetheinyl transferase (holo-ACP synthase)
MEKETQQLFEILAEQTAVLDAILEAQKNIRRVVNAKDWKQLERALANFDRLAGQFAVTEAKRAALCARISGADESGGLFAVLDRIPWEYRESLRDAFAQVRRKLAVSRIENAALNEYLKITQNFLQGVFTTLAENRSNKVYSRTGGIVRAQPERLVLDRLL